jgi:hypothetical protein
MLFEHVSSMKFVHLSFRFDIHFYGFFASLKNKSPCIYNFGDAMWFASGEESNGIYIYIYIVMVPKLCMYNITFGCIGGIPHVHLTPNFFCKRCGQLWVQIIKAIDALVMCRHLLQWI